MIKHHGEDAVIEASQKADLMLERGDLEGQRVWLRIIEAIKELERQEVPNGVVRH